MKIAKLFTFEAAHQLPNEDCYGKCRNLHGHTYKLEVTVDGEVNEKGWVMNFKDLKQIVNENVIDKLDHTFLNDVYPLSTAEIMVEAITNVIAKDLALLKDSFTLTSVECKLWETPTCYVSHKTNI